MDTLATILWTRLDVPGHDSCRLIRLADGWRLDGHAIFEHEEKPCSLAYRADCDDAWRARSASVAGFLGDCELSFEIARRADGDWLLNGAVQPAVSGLVDVDLGFTPATNLLAIHRFALAVGEETPAPAAYLAFPELTLDRLEQHYRRIDETRYDYAGSAFGYHEVLEVTGEGFVIDYPKLWRGRTWRPG
jgi:uncharacterized protein